MTVEDKFLEELNANIGIVHRVCRVYATDRDEREDLFQEIVFQLWRSFPGFQETAKFSTWMYRVALNTAIGGLRRQYRTIKKEPLTEKSQSVLADEPDHDDEHLELLYEAISELSPIEKAITMLHLDGDDYEQIAAVVGITANNVSVKLVRIRKKLEMRLKTKMN